MIPQEYQIPYDELELGRQLGKGELKSPNTSPMSSIFDFMRHSYKT